MEIEEGDLVVTPDATVETLKGSFDLGCVRWTTQEGGNYKEGNLVKANAPIRVRVSNEAEAECLVALAEDNEFDLAGNVWSEIIKFVPSEMTYHGIANSWDHDLTFESDYAQIKAWIEAHGESEDDECEGGVRVDWDKAEFNEISLGTGSSEDDECEQCNGRGQVNVAEDEPVGYKVMRDCPNCTDDFSEPRPEDDKKSWVNPFEYLTGKIPEIDRSMNHRNFTEYVAKYIDNLESELEDVRESRDYWKQCNAEKDEHRTKLLRRIEEAREEIKEAQSSKTLRQMNKHIANAEFILSRNQ